MAVVTLAVGAEVSTVVVLSVVVPEVLDVQVVPSDEVRIVPLLPTDTNETLEVVVLLESLFLAQEMTVRLIIDMRIICIILFIFFLHQ